MSIEKNSRSPLEGKIFTQIFPNGDISRVVGVKRHYTPQKQKFDAGLGWAAFQKCYKGSLFADSVEYDKEEATVTLIVCASCGIFVGKVYVGSIGQ